MALAVVLAAGCARKEHAASVIGGTLGGVLGAQIGTGAGRVAAATAGALGGSYLGGEIGRTMDEADRRRVDETLERSPTGRPVAWKNPDTGVAYEVTPTRTYDSKGMPCREYTTEAWIAGEREVVTGTACRQPDGTWEAI
ncbi:MAG: hypothetical protein GWN84_09470 [Gammaproteobacteria bacterium]|nr:hypothetical protein [Gammaproteobacteria bacterium]NIR83102.1 hypothetical protein [Gammaproteobacteria bacterium]NIR90764.1 hypothetical protein [Gammaproteobacteria bacterium]NIU04255.1 hypothetical protein [Gammaproteobacteria bacterium]NIV51547.1 hypothetical protein [Gammaproteobacteria bacterium]